MTSKQRGILWAIFLLSLISMLGSLYYSNYGDPVANVLAGTLFPDGGFFPCNLCWWARICMYPIAVVALIGIARNDISSVRYILPLAASGVLVSGYHTLIQQLPSAAILPCDPSNPCTYNPVEYFGFLSIPMLAVAAFVLLTVLSIEIWPGKVQDERRKM